MPLSDFLDNSKIAELLARQAESARQPVQKALRRASRRALMWPEEALDLVQEGRSLTEFPSVGPHIERLIRGWIDDPPPVPETPPIRRNFLTIPEVGRVLAENSLWRNGLNGDLQMHTDWSDGTGSIAEMADAAEQRDYKYIAITDHSKGLKIAGGIDEQQLARQAIQIESVNDEIAKRGGELRLLRSIELNLSPSGQGDMDEAALSRLDIVLGCFHSSLRKKEDQTERYLAALRNPVIQILGHPRGRIYNFRAGLIADWPRVFGLAAELDKALEIDAYPDRQDLSIDLLRHAKKEGCRISLGTDSHGPTQLGFIELALGAAAIVGIKRERILNFMTRDALLKWVGSMREGASGSKRRKRMQRQGGRSRAVS